MTQQNYNEDNPVQITGTRGLYHMVWKDIGIECKVSHMYDGRSDRSIHGYVKWKTSRPASSGHLQGGDLNFTSVSSRNTFVNRLKEADSTIDWRVCVEQLCENIIERYRKGSAVITLDTESVGNVNEESRYLVYPLIEAECINLFFGHGSHGKSLLAQLLACLLSEGVQEHQGLTLERSAPVLYLDYEEHKGALLRRVQSIRKGMNLSPDSKIMYRPMYQSISADRERLRDICLENNMQNGLLIVDSVSKAVGGEQQEQKAVTDMTEVIRQLQLDFGLSTLLLAHENKGGELFGSVFQWNEARNVFHIRKDQKEGESELSIGLFHQKSNNGGLLKRPVGYKVSFDEDGTTYIESQDVRTSAGLEQHMTVSNRIYNTLRNVEGGMTANDIAEQLFRPDGSPYRESHISKELSNNDSFVNIGNHKWAIRSVRDTQPEGGNQSEWENL